MKRTARKSTGGKGSKKQFMITVSPLPDLLIFLLFGVMELHISIVGI